MERSLSPSPGAHCSIFQDDTSHQIPLHYLDSSCCSESLTVNGAVFEITGVPVDGYLHWTISDNWEWADGYCPKFGLVDVDRSHNLTRRPRPSYFLYQQVRLKITLFLKNLYNFFYLVLACSIFRTVISVTMWAF